MLYVWISWNVLYTKSVYAYIYEGRTENHEQQFFVK